MPDGFFKVQVDRIVDEAAMIRSFRLIRLDGTPLPTAAPGSHVDVRTPGGPVRQYSLCEAGRTDAYTIAVKLEENSRGGSASMHRVAEGALIEIGPPRNTFPLAANARRHLLIAGGIGITPVLAMARHLAAANEAFEMHYFARSAEHAAFRATVTADPLGTRTRLHLGLDPESSGEALKRVLADPEPGTHVYACGPGPLVDSTRMIAQDLGWPQSALHEERFTAAPPDSERQTGFRVVLERSGATIEVAPDETVLDAIIRGGTETEYSCEQGICGTCVTRVLGGEIDHRDAYLTDEEKQAGDQMCVCVSRCLGPELRLDI